MTLEKYWGIRPDERGLFAQDFFYGAWLSDPNGLLRLSAIQTETDRLKAKPSRNATETKRLTSLEKQWIDRQTSLQTREQWADWLIEGPARAICQWCGRFTRLWVRKRPGHLAKTPGSRDFTDAPAWRIPPLVDSGLCPSCGLMVLSNAPGAKAFAGVKSDAKILLIAPDQYRAIQFGPWWEWPWTHAPALWTFYHGEPKRWGQRYWIHQALPTWNARSIAIWSKGQCLTLPGSGLQAIQADAAAQAHALHAAWSQGATPNELTELSKAFSRTAYSRWCAQLQMPSDFRELIAYLWIPTYENQKSTWTSANPSLKEDE